jgi:plastocyanin
VYIDAGQGTSENGSVYLGNSNAASVYVGNGNAGTQTLVYGGTGGIGVLTGNNYSGSSGYVGVGSGEGTSSSGVVAIASGNATAGTAGNVTIDVGTSTSGTGTLNIGNTNAGLIVLGNSTTSTTLNGALTIASNGSFTNNASTLFTAIAITNKATGGVIGTAAATVDIATTFNINQTTASQTLTLPSPTNTTAGRVAFVNNIGTVSFSMHGVTIAAGTYATFMWNGSVWLGEAAATATAGGTVSSIGTINSQTKSANGAVLASNQLILQTADASNPGLVSTGSQTFAGDKIFQSSSTAALTIQNSSAVNLFSADTTNATITVGSSTPVTKIAAKVDYTTATLPRGTVSADFNRDVLNIRFL